jgi:hypothetical protein
MPPGRRPGGADSHALKSLLQIEREIGRLEGRLNEVSDALAVAGIDADTEAVARLGTEYERLQTTLESTYADWEALTTDAELTAAAAGTR